MARIILKTNLANKTFTVESKSVEVVKGRATTPPATDILISPINGFWINAKDFSMGALPSSISKVVFRNSSKIINEENKIIATIYFKRSTYALDFKTIFLPISGASITALNEINLIESSPIDSNIFDNYSNTYNMQQSTLADSMTKIVHKIKGSPGQNISVFSKTIKVPEGYYFPQEPTFSIDSELINYKVTTSIIRDDENNITSKTFNVSTIFPTIPLRKNYNDTIRFNYRSSIIRDTYAKLLKEDKVEKQIYDIDTGATIGSAGGIKRIAVKGVPGTPFKVIISNASNQSYNFKTGNFEEGGFFLEGNIPPVKTGMGYGIYKASIKVPAGDGNTIKTSLISNNKVDHKALKDKYDVTVTGPSSFISNTTSSIVKPDGELRVNLYNGEEGGYIIARPLEETTAYITESNLYEHEGISYIKGETGAVYWGIGPTNYNTDITNHLNSKPFKLSTLSGGGNTTTMSYLVTTNAESKYIIINRQPKFDQRENYLAWDSYYSTDRYKRYNSAGVEILNDFQNAFSGSAITDYQDFKLNISASVQGVGSGPPHGLAVDDPKMYKFVRVTITVNGTIGTDVLKTGLNAQNFLSIKTIT